MTVGKILEDDVTAKHPAGNAEFLLKSCIIQFWDEHVHRMMIEPGVEFTAVLEPQTFQAQIAMAKLRIKIRFVTILKKTTLLIGELPI